MIADIREIGGDGLNIIIIIINITLLVVALRHCLKHQNYRCGNRLIWICVI